jgi:two-component system NtrC family sensor kinase
LKKYFLSLRFRLMLAFVGVMALLGSAVIYNGYQIIIQAMVENVRGSVKQTSQILNLAVSPFAFKDDLKSLKIYLSELIVDDNANGDLNYLVIGREDGSILLVTGKFDQLQSLPLPDQNIDIAAAVERGVVNVRQPLLLADNSVGFIQYGLSTKLLVTATRQSIRQGAIVAALGLIFGTVLMFYLSSLFSRRIAQLIKATSAVSEGNYSQSVPEQGEDEIALLARHFNMMSEAIQNRIRALEESRAEVTQLNKGLELRVAERTKELLEVNKTLAKTIDDLKQTQQSLIQAEKLASLGSLVAGLAHELNTPLGNALIMATTLEDRTREFIVESEKGLKRSSLDNYVELVRSSSPLITRNLLRASELITSFKSVAVDQASSQRRTFDFKDCVDEIVLTLQPQFKRTAHRIMIDVPTGLKLDGYPGALGQVITNLTLNALIHGFEGLPEGVVLIKVSNVGDERVCLTISDNGRGIPTNDLPKIFDPFFTTKLGEGGSGLGLNIVYSIVTGVLGGSIEVSSKVGQGATFTIIIPIRAPVRQG